MPTNNLEESAQPFIDEQDPSLSMFGLTKREYAAIHLGIPASGDAELNRMIRRALLLKLVVAFNGRFAHMENKKMSREALEHARYVIGLVTDNDSE